MQTDPRIHVTLQHLRSVGGSASGLSFLPRSNAASALNGRHVSRLRGRGLNFEEMRDYRSGDDIRSIDWKATARTGTPHVRVFTEERDRPALLVVDQRMSMFFGSTLNMKSTTAAEAAAMAAFRILDAGDRIGGIVFDDEGQEELPPRRSARTLNRFLETLAETNQRLHADREVSSQPGELNHVLRSVARIAHHDHLVMVFSDFVGIDGDTHRHLSGIAAHNDVVLFLVTDPLARDLGAGGRTVIGDHALQADLDLGSKDVHEAIARYSTERIERIEKWQMEINLSVLPLSAGEETLPQVRGLMGHPTPARRAR